VTAGADRALPGGPSSPSAEARAERARERRRQRIAERREASSEVRSAAGKPFVQRLEDIWEHREVARMLTVRGLQRKYASSVLGYAWSLIEPAMLIVTYFLLLAIFHRSQPKYPLFIGSTILPWQWFQSTVNSANTSLRSNARLITSVNLPREIYPLADAAEKAVEFLLSLPIVLVVALFYGVTPSGYVFLLPLALALEAMICVGMALLISALNTVLRDVQRGIGIVLRMMFYLVPVLYPLTSLTPQLRRIESIDPLVGVLQVFRAVWLPGYWTGYQPLLFSVVGSVIVFVGGIAVFVRLEPTVLKEL
jgi:ABC-2 type transport system permease protein